MFLLVYWQASVVHSFLKDLEAHDQIRLQINPEESSVLRVQGGDSKNILNIHLR
jgi:hypothetical protein